MNETEINLTPINKLIIFGIVTAIGLTGWLVFDVILLPELFTPTDHTETVSVSITPRLSLAAVALMSQKRSFSETELSQYNVYVTEDSYSGGELRILPLQIRTPYDRGYYTLTRN